MLSDIHQIGIILADYLIWSDQLIWTTDHLPRWTDFVRLYILTVWREKIYLEIIEWKKTSQHTLFVENLGIFFNILQVIWVKLRVFSSSQFILLQVHWLEFRLLWIITVSKSDKLFTTLSTRLNWLEVK